MVCEKCQKKLKGVVVPDRWKEGANNVASSKDTKKTNPLLSKKDRFTPYSARCKDCKALLHQGGIYCQTCAYKKGVCAMCGVKVLDTKFYKQSNK